MTRDQIITQICVLGRFLQIETTVLWCHHMRTHFFLFSFVFSQLSLNFSLLKPFLMSSRLLRILCVAHPASCRTALLPWPILGPQAMTGQTHKTDKLIELQNLNKTFWFKLRICFVSTSVSLLLGPDLGQRIRLLSITGASMNMFRGS